MNAGKLATCVALAVFVVGCGARVPPPPPKLSQAPKVTLTGLDEVVKLSSAGLSENKRHVQVMLEKVKELHDQVPITITFKAGGAVLQTQKEALHFDVVVTEGPYELSLPGRISDKPVDEIEISMGHR